MAWTARTTAPDADNIFYIHTGYYNQYGDEGVNECLIIDYNTGSVMPNCVGYTWGRWYEGLGTRPNLYRGDAQYWYAYTADGYQRDATTPQLGAIACFSGGGYGGHVAVVERIITSAMIITSNSAYNGNNFWMETLTYNSNTDEWERPYSGYSWQGFILPPSGGSPDIAKIITRNRRFSNGRGRIINNRRF